MNTTTDAQRKALIALGYPFDGLQWVGETSDHVRLATDVHSAIMWLLASERGRKLWGAAAHVRTYGDGDSCLVLRNGGFIGSREENRVCTPSQLLDAMLAAVTEASDA